MTISLTRFIFSYINIICGMSQRQVKTKVKAYLKKKEKNGRKKQRKEGEQKKEGRKGKKERKKEIEQKDYHKYVSIFSS